MPSSGPGTTAAAPPSPAGRSRGRPRKVVAHAAWQKSFGAEQQDQDYEYSVEQEPVLLDELQLLRHDNDDKCRRDNAQRVAEPTENQDRDQDQRLSEREVVGRDE